MLRKFIEMIKTAVTPVQSVALTPSSVDELAAIVKRSMLEPQTHFIVRVPQRLWVTRAFRQLSDEGFEPVACYFRVGEYVALDNLDWEILE